MSKSSVGAHRASQLANLATLLLGVIITSTWLPRATFAAAPITISPLQAKRAGDPNIYTGPKDPNPKVPAKWDVLLSPGVLGIHVAAVAGTDKFYFVGRANPTKLPAGQPDELAGVYDLAGNTFQNTSQVATYPFCCGLALTADGLPAVVGGNFKSPSGLPDGRTAIRLFNPAQPDVLREVPAKMKQRRWYPTVTLLPDQRFLINGGTQSGAETGTPTTLYETWDPRKEGQATVAHTPDAEYQRESGKGFYPFTWVLPTGDTYVQIDSISRFVKPDMTFRKNVDGSYLAAPPYPKQWKTQFPRLGTAVMLPLSADSTSAEVVVFGGAPTTNQCNATVQDAQKTPANPYSYRLKISWAKKGADWAYTFSQWEEEDSGIPRVGGESVLLPNGDVVLLGGCQTGCVGGIVKGLNRGANPAVWTQLYQPDKPSGQRYTVMQATTLPRTYHGTGALTRKGTILVAGCDACNSKYFTSTATFLTKLNTRRDYRVEVFTPPYALDVKAQPAITSIDGDANDAGTVKAKHGDTLTITWQPFTASETDVAVTSVVLVAPSAVTHGFNSNQRVVILPITSGAAPVTSSSLTVQVPDNVNLLPPQFYMLFLLNGKTYSPQGRWVQLLPP